MIQPPPSISRIYQARFLLNGQERTEKIPAATPYDAIKYIQAKYAAGFNAVYVYHVTVFPETPKSEGRP